MNFNNDPNQRPPPRQQQQQQQPPSQQQQQQQYNMQGMSIPPNQMRMYPPQQQQQQMAQQRFQNMQQQQHQMPPGGGPPPGMMQQQKPMYPAITPENFNYYFDKLPPQLREKFKTLPPEQHLIQLQRLFANQMQQKMKMEAQAGHQGFPPQQQPPRPQRMPMPSIQGNSDVQGGFIPGGGGGSMDQKPQVPFPGPGPTTGQKRKGPSPAVNPPPPAFPGPGPTAQNPSTISTTPTSSQPPQQPPPIHQSQSHPSLNIQHSQPPPQNLPNQDLKFGNQVKTEPPHQQQQQQFGIPTSQQQQQQQHSQMPSSQSQPSLQNQNSQMPPKFEFQNQPRPEMPQQMQQQDFNGPPPPPQHQQQQMQMQMHPSQQQQNFNNHPSMGQPMPQQQQQPFYSQQQPPQQQQQQPQMMPPHNQQQQQQPSQQQQQLLQPRPPSIQQAAGMLPSNNFSGQGPSPATIPSGVVASVGRVPTPSNKSATSGGTLSQDFSVTKEYQETLMRLQKYREICHRLLHRIRLEQDSALSGMLKTIDVIEGRKQVSIELMEKLIKNINQINQRYDVSNGLKKCVEIIKKTPTINMSNLIPDPYEQYKHLRISAPKEYYKEADDARNDRKQHQYIQKRMQWFSENYFWDGSEPTPYPWKRAIRQYSREKMEEMNREYNVKMEAPPPSEDDKHGKGGYVPKDPNEKKSISFNAQVEYLRRVDAKSDDHNALEYDERESDESEDDVIAVEGEEEFESVDEEEHDGGIANYDALEAAINHGNNQLYYDSKGMLQNFPPLAVDHQEEDQQQKKKKEDSEEDVEQQPPTKRIKLEESSEAEPSAAQEFIHNPPYDFNYGTYPEEPPEVITVPAPIPNYAQGVEDPAASIEDTEIAQSYEAYLRRQQQASYYESLALNTQIIQDELYSNAMIMPSENYYENPVMNSSPHNKEEPLPECPYSCCCPYEVESIMGKPAILPRAAATELRKFRHRVDYENQPLSEHSPFYAVIINPTKANAKFKYPELRINIPKSYPSDAIDFEIVKPSSLHGKAAKKFYENLEKRMFDRRLCGISLHTIGEVVSAFRYCVEFVHRKRDLLDFSNVNIVV